jgi:hypothetical protein
MIPFRPVSPAEWGSDTLDLTNYLGSSGFKLKFKNLGRNGNTVWIDNINMSGLVGLSEPGNEDQWGFTVSPNPFFDRMELHYQLESKSKTGFALYDLHGREVLVRESKWKAPGIYREELPENQVQELPAGIYFLRGTFGGSSVTLKMVKMN